jgi:3,4-dihydroxy-2-butanone 4-phosphate synthase
VQEEDEGMCVAVKQVMQWEDCAHTAQHSSGCVCMVWVWLRLGASLAFGGG